MNDEVIRKIIEMTKKDLLSRTIIKKEDSDDTLTFMYDGKTKRYSVILSRVLEDGKKDIKEKTALTLEEVIPFIKNPEFNSGVLNAYKNRLEKETKYEQAKQKLLQELESMDISDKDRETMQAIIEQVSQLPEYVGMANRVTITNDYYMFREELRLADETNWNDQGSTLHLQLVQEADFGMKHHNYPQKTFAELVKYVSDKNISLDVKRDNVPDKDKI